MTKLFIEEGKGGSPKSVFNRLQAERKIPAQFEDIQLLALPNGTDSIRYIEAIGSQFNGTQAGCFILYLGDDKVKIPREELTGKCSNNEVVFKGQRKWVTVYVAYQYNQKKFYDEEGQIVLIDEPIEISAHPTKGEAVDAAKTHAVDNHCKTFIKLEKRLDENSGQQFIAEYEPQTKTVYDEKVIPQNRYLFFGHYEETEAETSVDSPVEALEEYEEVV